MIRPILVITATSILASGLAGCGTTSERMLRQAVGYECNSAEGTISGWVCGADGEPVAPVSRYCYQTLGVTNCFDRPDPDSNNSPQGSTGY